MSDSTTNPGVKPAVFSVNLQGIRRDNVIKMYEEWITFEEDFIAEGYLAPLEASKLVANYYPNDVREDISIIDIAAGSGFVGIELKKLGFTNIDALEPTSLLERAKERGVYNKYFKEYLDVDAPCSINPDSYDCATAVGCFAGTHIPEEALEEVMRIVKPGGLIFVTVRDLEENDGLKTVAEDLGRRGLLTTLQTVPFPQFRVGHAGITYVYQKM